MENTKYAIERKEHGVAIYGSVPISELTTLFDKFEKDGWTLVDPGIGTALGASFALTNEDHQEKWRKKLRKKARDENEDPVEAWIEGPDTGVSSATIYHVLHNKPWCRIPYDSPDTPKDAADFGRCVQLLDVAPDKWRERLEEVVDTYPEWEDIVDEWETLESAWRNGDQKEITRLIRNLN